MLWKTCSPLQTQTRRNGGEGVGGGEGRRGEGRGREWRGGEAYSFVTCHSNLTIDHAALPRRSAVPTPNKYTSDF